MAQVDLANWMAQLPNAGGRPVSSFSLPGTHDTMTYDFNAWRKASSFGYAQCQEKSLQEQLEGGVRCIDIRCRHFKNTFEIHHGEFYTGFNFDNVLDICRDFLARHKGETILMYVKEEHKPEGCTNTFEQTCRGYTNARSAIFYTRKIVPTLSQAQGKIVLLRRFPVAGDDKNMSDYGIRFQPWAEDADDFMIPLDGNTVSAEVQDRYKVVNVIGKWNVIKSLLEKASNGAKPDPWFMNFISGTGIGTPLSVAWEVYFKGMNGHLLDYLNENPKAHVGTLMLDFPFRNGNALTTAFVQRNFP